VGTQRQRLGLRHGGENYNTGRCARHAPEDEYGTKGTQHFRNREHSQGDCSRRILCPSGDDGTFGRVRRILGPTG
jgi:hypothetical protein